MKKNTLRSQTKKDGLDFLGQSAGRKADLVTYLQTRMKVTVQTIISLKQPIAIIDDFIHYTFLQIVVDPFYQFETTDGVTLYHANDLFSVKRQLNN